MCVSCVCVGGGGGGEGFGVLTGEGAQEGRVLGAELGRESCVHRVLKCRRSVSGSVSGSVPVRVCVLCVRGHLEVRPPCRRNSRRHDGPEVSSHSNGRTISGWLLQTLDITSCQVRRWHVGARAHGREGMVHSQVSGCSKSRSTPVYLYFCAESHRETVISTLGSRRWWGGRDASRSELLTCSVAMVFLTVASTWAGLQKEV